MHSRNLAKMRTHRAEQIHQSDVLRILAKAFNLDRGMLNLLRADGCAREDFDILGALHDSGLADLPACLRIEPEPIGSLAWFDGKTLYASALWKRLAESLRTHGEVLTVVHVKDTGDYVMCTALPDGDGDRPRNGPRPASYWLDGRDVWRVPLKEYAKRKEFEQYG